jgi:hypothetical protein
MYVYLFTKCSLLYVKWVPCHHGVARPQVADGRDGLQIGRAAANIATTQSRIADKGCPPPWRSGDGLTTPHRKNKSRNATKGLGLGRISWNHYLFMHLFIV